MSHREELGYDCRPPELQYCCRGIRCPNRGHHRACYLGANAISTITASPLASPVTVAMQTQAGGLGKAQHSRALLLTAHAHLAVRPKRNARKLFKRLRQGTVLISWLIEQAATIERIRRRAKRRCNLRAGLI